MARCTDDDPHADDPIVLPLLRNDPFNLALHDQIYLDMQSCVLEPIEKQMDDKRNDKSQQIWSPARDIIQDSTRAHNWQNTHSHNLTNNCKINNSSCRFDDLVNVSKNLIAPHCDGENTMSAIKCLENCSRKLCNESECNTNSHDEIHIGAIDKSNCEIRRDVWSTYSEISDLKSSLMYYGFPNRSDESDNNTEKSCDTCDEPDK